MRTVIYYIWETDRKTYTAPSWLPKSMQIFEVLMMQHLQRNEQLLQAHQETTLFWASKIFHSETEAANFKLSPTQNKH